MGKRLLSNLILDDYERKIRQKNNIKGEYASCSFKKDMKFTAADREVLVYEAKELEELKLIKIKWISGYRNYDLESISYLLSGIRKLYELTGRVPKQVKAAEYSREVMNLYNSLVTPWIKEYVKMEILTKAEKGIVEKDTKKLEYTKLLFQCLPALDKLDTPIFKRIFSKRYLHNSKVFEEKLQKTIIAKARKYNSSIDESMEKSQVLEQLYIEEYAQELHLKGSLLLELDGVTIDTGIFHYGTVLNTQTLKNARILENQSIKKIYTIENKANFVMEPYEEGTLILFSHGFFTPLERIFLSKLADIMKTKEVTYIHSGDLDYGGIRIFQFIKNRIFPELKPFKMDSLIFEKYVAYGEKVDIKTLKKLKKCEEPLLDDVISKIIETGVTIEQEAFL